MQRREMIFLVLAGVGALYAVYALFLAPAPGKGLLAVVLDRAGLEKSATEAKDLVEKSKPTALDMFTLSRAESAFPRDPFHRTTSPDEVAAAKDKSEISFAYRGFLEMDGERFAIINGMEYRVGEELETAGYHLSQIERNKVVIEYRTPGQGLSSRISVPIQETETSFFKKEGEGNGTAP